LKNKLIVIKKNHLNSGFDLSLVPLDPLQTFQMVLNDKRKWSAGLTTTLFLNSWCCIHCL